MDLNALARTLLRDQRPRSRRSHRLATATATTADGVVALIQVQYVAELDDDTDHETLDDTLADAVEAATRRAIARWHVADLPSAGNVADWVPEEIAGARVEHAAVTLSDVQVTSELRRLVAVREAESP